MVRRSDSAAGERGLLLLTAHCSLLTSFGTSRVAFAFTLLLLAAQPSCSDHDKRTWRFRSAAENYRIALEAAHPDERRDAVASIGESGYVTSDDAFGVLDAVARTDTSTHVRSVAVSAFKRYQDGRPAGTLLKILRATADNHAEALPADDELRAATASALADLAARGLLNSSDQAATCAVFISLAGPDAARPVRIVALHALGHFPERRALAPLLQALKDRDFMLVDAAEHALIALTGTTHNYDPEAWEQWLANTADPFAHTDPQPVATRPASAT